MTANGLLLRRTVDAVALIGLLLLVWQGLYDYAGEIALTSPLETIRLSAKLMVTPWFWPHLEETSLALAQGLVIAMVGGLAMGLLLGAHKLAGEVGEPILVALYSIPKITLYPIILLFFGLGMPAKVAFGAIHGIIPVIIFSMSAVRNIRR